MNGQRTLTDTRGIMWCRLKAPPCTRRSNAAAAAGDIDRVGGARDHSGTLVHEAGVRSGHEGEDSAVSDTEKSHDQFLIDKVGNVSEVCLHSEEAAAREVESRHGSYQKRCVCYESASWVSRCD